MNGEMSLHLLNFVHLFEDIFGHTFFTDLLVRYESIVFGLVVISVLSLVFYFASRKSSLIPGKLQSACEVIIDGLNNFVCGILGPEGRKYTPFLGTIFLYIWTMNKIGLFPLMKNPNANAMTLKL